MSTSLERDTERKLISLCKSLKIRCEKLKLASKSGWPDRTLLYKGHVMFLELKRNKETPEPLQEYTLAQLRAEGFDARWADDWEQIQVRIIAWKHYVDSTTARPRAS